MQESILSDAVEFPGVCSCGMWKLTTGTLEEIESMKRQIVSACRVVLAGTCLLSGIGRADSDDASAEQQNREAAFVEQLSGCVLTGSFTVDGQTDKAPKTERYDIESVSKLTGNLWTFMVRIRYGERDARLPVAVPVIWAGDTPMVSLTDQSLPGLGDAFSARVIFHGDRYAGTWQHGDKGGHMFGTIRKTAKNGDSKADTQ
ncbi:MAG: hypothetical protein R3C49_03860 [Planctomycetaceae bacterium]